MVSVCLFISFVSLVELVQKETYKTPRVPPRKLAGVEAKHVRFGFIADEMEQEGLWVPLTP